MKQFLLSLTLAGASLNTLAVSIDYTSVVNGQASGQVTPGTDWKDPSEAQYFNFQLAEADSVTITGQRQDFDYDMAFWLFEGLFNDTEEFGPIFDSDSFIEFADDEIPHPGPFGDPWFFDTLAAGWYTIAVVNYVSGPNAGANGMFDFNLYVQSVPEPSEAMWSLLGLGAVALGVARRRRA